MQQILTLAMGEHPIRIFLDVLKIHGVGSPRHTHRYAELHAFLEGEGRYTVEGQTYSLTAGDVILIPAGALHETSCTPDAKVVDFETDLGIAEVRTLRLPASLGEELRVGAGRGVGSVIPTLCYLFAHLTGDGLYTLRPNGDYADLIDAYIKKNYHRPLRLSELGAELCLSERQTQRVIRSLTGGTFSQMLTAHRITVAEELMRTTEMTLSEIAVYVGFSTYSGFLRARRRVRGE